MAIAVLNGVAGSLSWASSTAVSVLVSGSDIVSATVGGQSSTLNAPAGATTVSAGNGVRDVRVLTSTGELMQASGTSWQNRVGQVLVLAQQTGVR